jgi:predicted NAD/FAD-dependent oxidoreductase
MARIAIVGAGTAGLTAAYGLRGVPVDVTMFEKSRGFGGRAATRGRYGCRYDHGAPYLRTTSPRATRLVTAHLSTEQLVEIGRPIGTFDAAGTIEAGPPDADRGPRWTYVQGISTLGKLLARRARAEVHRDTRVEAITRHEDRWRLHTADGHAWSGYDAVVLTPPAPQSAALLERAASEGGLGTVHDALSAVDYAPQFAFALAYDRRLPRPQGCWGLTCTAADHPIDWVGIENEKPGHVRAGQTLLVVHTAPSWTAPRVDRAPEDFLDDVKTEVGALLGTDLRQPTWYDTQRWRYARPRSGLQDDTGAVTAADGLVLAGDFVSGTGTVAAALESGFDAAGQVRRLLGA